MVPMLWLVLINKRDGSTCIPEHSQYHIFYNSHIKCLSTFPIAHERTGIWRPDPRNAGDILHHGEHFDIYILFIHFSQLTRVFSRILSHKQNSIL